MKKSKRLAQSLRDIETNVKRNARAERLEGWLKTQPLSVRRGVLSGRIPLPDVFVTT